MPRDEVPEEARRLIADHITSVEQLEILLLLRDRPGEVWTAGRVSEEIRTSNRSASQRLAQLRERGLVAASEEGGGTAYRFEPASAALGRSVDLLAQAYAERRYTVIELIFAKPIDQLRVYADAFRFRKDDSDG